MGNLVSLKRRHWMIIALLVGAAAGFAARPTSLDLQHDYGQAINGQKDFESALVKEVQGSRRFKDLVIHRQSVDATSGGGGARYAWVISGRYCPGFPDRLDGNLHWRPAVYVAADPYRPKSNLSELLPSASATAIGKFNQRPNATALDFLQLLSQTAGVDYTHAWWRTYALTTWLIASFTLLGVLAPTTIDLVVFGRLIRPREEKGTKLTPAPLASPATKPELSEEERARLAALEAAMEEGLQETATSSAAAPSSSAATAAPMRKLNGQPDAPPAAITTEDARTFGAKPDDYYPTEQKAKRMSSKPRS